MPVPAKRIGYNWVFDSGLRKAIIEELSDLLPNVSRIHGLDESNDILTAVDGTLIEVFEKNRKTNYNLTKII